MGVPLPPILATPTNGSTMISRTPVFGWNFNPGPLATGYKVYCDTNNPPTTEIADVATNSYTHTTELLPETVYYWTVKAYNADGTSDAATAFSFTTMPDGLVIIGDGTVDQKLPLNPYYGYSYSQSIYLQPEINTSDQRIEKISYYWNGAGVGTNSSGWTVYMGHTDKTAFNSVSDWISLSALTQVFSGNAAIPSTAGWVEIVLQTPFVYNNVQNLVIAVDENTSSYDGSTQFFYNTNVSTNRSLLYYSDSTNPDPASPPATGGYLITAYPNIMMQLGDLPTSPIFTYSPETIDFGTVMNGETSDPVNVRISNTGSGTINLNASDISIIGPNAAEFAFDPINLPASLSAGQSVNIPVTVTGITEGNISATLRVVYDSENYDVSLTAEVMPAGIVFIGDGSSAQRWPFGTSWGFEHSASLYKADEINLNGLLTMVGWDCAATSATAIPYKIWAKNTTETSLTAQTWTSIAADLTLLKEGTYTFNTPGWHGFTFDTPFVYTGGNLIIVTESTYGGTGGGTGHTFKYTTGTAGSHQYWYSDNTFNPEQVGVANSSRPNLMLHIAEPIAGPPAEPILTYPADGAISLPKAGFNLTWSPDLINGGIPEYYQVFLASDEGTIYDEYYWETENTYFNPVTEGGMSFDYLERWYWTVQAINNDGAEVADPPYSFIIIAAPPHIDLNLSSISADIVMGDPPITEQLMISNTGGLPLNFSMTFAEDTREQRITPYDPNRPIRINPNASLFAERSDNIGALTLEQSRAIFDLQFSYEAIPGEYGVASDGEYIYTSYWATPGKFGKYDLDGSFIESFTITGGGGTRDMCYDGQYFYGASGSDTIHIYDFDARSIEGTITSPFSGTRGIAYDEDVDGFWLTDGWTANSRLIDRSGATLRTLTLGGGSNGGITYDNLSEDTPMLWGFVQDQVNNNLLVQYDLSDGSIAQSFDLTSLIPDLIAAEASAGGMEIVQNFVPGTATLMTMSQGHSINGLELCPMANWASASPRSGVINPGEDMEIDILFDPSEVGPGTHDGSFTISHNDPSQDAIELPVTMNVTGIWPAEFSITPTFWDYDYVEVLNPAVKQFTIKNIGGSDPAPLIINAGAISISGDLEGNFSVDAPGLPVSLNHNETYSFNVSFTPQSIGAKTATLNISDNRLAHSLALSGTGIAEILPGGIALNGAVNGDNINLSWVPYAADGLLHWDDGINDNAIGAGAGNTFSVAARFPSAILASYAGQYLSSIKIYANDADDSDFTLKVWTGTDASYVPVTEIFSQDVSPIEGWNEFNITSIPIPATGSLFIGYEVTPTNASFPAGCDAGPSNVYYGDLVSLGGAWDSLYEIADIEGNWNIQGVISASAKGAVTLTNIPVQSQQNSVKTERPSFSKANLLSNAPTQNRALIGYNVYRNSALITPAPIMALAYADEALIPGDYEYQVEAVYYTDTVLSNTWNGTVLPPTVYPLPFTEDWSSSSFDTQEWLRSGGTNWSIDTSAGSPAPSAKFGWNPNVVDYTQYLTSALMDGSGLENVTLSFDLYLNNYSTSAENQMAVEVYDGSTWVPVHNSSSLGGSMPWTSFSYNISALALDREFKIRFKAYGEDSYEINYWNVDNIVVQEVLVDETPPTIAHLPLINTPIDDVDYIVSAVIVDDATWNNPISGAQLYYDAGDGEMMLNMLAGADDLYTAAIPAQELGTWIEYYIKAWDSEDNVAQTDEYAFAVYNPVWIYYSGGPTTFMGSSGSTFGAGIVFENPFYGSGNPLQVLAVDAESYNSTTAVLMVYEFDGDDLTPAMDAMNVNLPADYTEFDLEALEVYIESPMFAVTYHNIPSGNYFAWDEDINYGMSLFNSGSGWGFLSSDGTWCFGAFITNVVLDAPEVNIALIDGDVVLDWNPVDGAASYHVLGSDDPYADPWTLLNTVSTPEYTHSGSEAMKFFKVIADSDAATKGRRQIIRPERPLNNVINKTKRNIELGKPMKMLLK